MIIFVEWLYESLIVLDQSEFGYYNYYYIAYQLHSSNKQALERYYVHPRKSSIRPGTSKLH